jgi:hypothetical protein
LERCKETLGEEMVKPILYGLMGGIIIIAITITVYPENAIQTDSTILEFIK